VDVCWWVLVHRGPMSTIVGETIGNFTRDTLLHWETKLESTIPNSNACAATLEFVNPFGMFTFLFSHLDSYYLVFGMSETTLKIGKMPLPILNKNLEILQIFLKSEFF
jgi:hypothetical protein